MHNDSNVMFRPTTHNDPTILLSRRPRRVGEDWTAARSWLGGAPCLGDRSWPRDKDGQPLHFLAQVDLADVAAKIGATSLPTTGSLAFFVGDTNPVIYVPPSRERSRTEPPADMPEPAACGGSPHWRSDLAGRRLFPFWPLDFTALELPPTCDDDDDDHTTAQVAAVKRHFKHRQHILSAALAFAGPPIPDWWQTAIHLADDLGKALRGVPGVLVREQQMLAWAHDQVQQARAKGAAELNKAEASVALYESRLAKARAREPAFADFVAEVTAWTAGREPWDLMAPEDMARLAAYWARNPQFADFTHYHGAVPVDVLKDKMFKALPAAGEASFAALPAAVRDLITARRAPRPVWWHSALHFASELDVAAERGIALASKSTRGALEADRTKLARLRPGGSLGPFYRMVDGKSQERDELEARIAANEAKLAERRPLEAAFRQLVHETSEWCSGRDPWNFMTPADIAQFDVRLKCAAKEFKDFARPYVQTRLEDLEGVTLRTLATADDRGYATLPEQVRALINEECLLPPGGWHQMFGRGIEIQDTSAAMREDGHIMLLQLAHDEMMHWSFGDCGVYQFWISPENLARRNWSAVQMTFECH
jgi:Domain of unknown function (DUF1963)